MSEEQVPYARTWRTGDEWVVGVVLPTEDGPFLVLHRVIRTRLTEPVINYQQASTTIGPLSSEAQARAALLGAMHTETLQQEQAREDEQTAPEAPLSAPPETPPAAPDPEVEQRLQEQASRRERKAETGVRLRTFYETSVLTARELGEVFNVSRANARKWMTGEIPAGWLDSLDQFLALMAEAAPLFPTAGALRAWLMTTPPGKIISPYELLRNQQPGAFRERLRACIEQHQQESQQHGGRTVQEATRAIQALTGLSVKSIVALLKTSGTQYYLWLKGEVEPPNGVVLRRLYAVLEALEDAAGRFEGPRQLYYWLLTAPERGEETPYQMLQREAFDEFRTRVRNHAEPAAV